MKIANRLLSIVLAVMVVAGAVPLLSMDASAASTQGLGTKYRTQAEIRQFYKDHLVTNMDFKFKTNPSVTYPYAYGEVSQDCLDDALNQLNMFRYIAGVDPVSINTQSQKYAQGAALISAIRGQCIHGGTAPSNMPSDMASVCINGSSFSNLAEGGTSLSDTIIRYILETNGDTENFGHRRQLLKPELADCGTGFGAAVSSRGGNFMSAYVGSKMADNIVMSYPGENQPLEYFGPGYAWTVTVPQTISASSVLVTVTDTKTNKKWEFSTSKSNLQISTEFRSPTLIFAPDNIIYRDGDKYKVDITGIPNPIQYYVNMFYVADRVPVTSVSCGVGTALLYADPDGTGNNADYSTPYLLRADVEPENASNKNVVWTSADPSIAYPEWYGTYSCTIKALKVGTTTFTATTDDGGYKTTVQVVVKPRATSIVADDEVTIGRGQSAIITTKVLPEEADDSTGYSYTSYDKDIVKVEETNKASQTKVTGLKNGTTQIRWYARSDHKVTKTTVLKVVDPVYVTGITLNESRVELFKAGDTFQLVAALTPGNATVKEVTWSTSKSPVATVDQNGLVTLNGSAGYADITATATVASTGGLKTVSATCRIIKHSHTIEKVDAVSPSCEKDGVREYWTCKGCGVMYGDPYGFTRITEPVVDPAYGHSYSTTYTVDTPATCTSEGVKSMHCTRCGKVKAGSEVTIEKTAHSCNVWVVTKAATCTEPGIRTSACSVCSKKITEEIPAAHSWMSNYTIDVDATCTHVGSKSIHCSKCNEVKPGSVKTITKSPHTYNAWTVVRAATTDQEGLQERKCSVCGYTQQKTIPKVSREDSGSGSESGSGDGSGNVSGEDDEDYWYEDEEDWIDGEVSPYYPVKASVVHDIITSSRSDADQPGSTYGQLQAKGAAKSASTIKLSWKYVPGAQKYIIYGNRCGKNNTCVKLQEAGGLTTMMSGLKRGTYYKYIVVAVKGDKALAISKTIHVATKGGKVGNPKSVKVKKKKVSLKRGKKFKLKATAVPQSKKLKVKKHRAVSYEVSNPYIATVNRKGVIKAYGRGTCYVYAYAQNGVSKRIKLTIK